MPGISFPTHTLATIITPTSLSTPPQPSVPLIFVTSWASSRVTPTTLTSLTAPETEHIDSKPSFLDSLQYLQGSSESHQEENSFNNMLDTLLPSYKEVLSPIPLPTYKGKSIHKILSEEGTSNPTTNLELTQEQEHTWSKGFGFVHSPIKTRSARRKEGHILPSTTDSPSQHYDNGALRGIKSLACAK
jgi:hypothetical protein